MRVDVLISGTWPKTLLQNIYVISLEQGFKEDAGGKPVAVHVVYLLVTPEQAEQLSLATPRITIHLPLRTSFPADVPPPLGRSLRPYPPAKS